MWTSTSEFPVESYCSLQTIFDFTGSGAPPSVEIEFETDDQYRQKKIVALVSDTAGRRIKVAGEYFPHFPLVPVPSCTLIEGAMRCEVDGRPGVGWSEFMWPTTYLHYLQMRKKD